jgi:hypothetical protein
VCLPYRSIKSRLPGTVPTAKVSAGAGSIDGSTGDRPVTGLAQCAIICDNQQGMKVEDCKG